MLDCLETHLKKIKSLNYYQSHLQNYKMFDGKKLNIFIDLKKTMTRVFFHKTPESVFIPTVSVYRLLREYHE